MSQLVLRELHQGLNARFSEVNGMQAVNDYGDWRGEHAALCETAGVLDLSFRSRLCLTGGDRQKFLNGQVTNNVKDLKTGEGCYAALVNAKGRMESDLNIYILENEILLDFEPGLSAAVSQRLEKYIIADDVQVVDVAPHYGLLSVQGPKAVEVVNTLGFAVQHEDPAQAPAPSPRPSTPVGERVVGDRVRGELPAPMRGLATLPAQPFAVAKFDDAGFGEVYLMNLARTGTTGFDLFVPNAALAAVADRFVAVVKAVGGCVCGWQSLETARMEAGIPRFGADMDETNLAPEAGIEERAISYSKGCYIGQEVIARIRTYGQVAKSLRGLRLTDSIKVLPQKGDKLYDGEKEVGYVTSAVGSPTLKCGIALAYVRREHNRIGTELKLRTATGEGTACIVPLPFQR
ncbi:MAG TPA: aminomethyltransferase family protein [Verrucomicrobiae bacterium]|nr:aminomethyltransferase family protein [Verrucomicrobiae bacterium]